MISYTKLWLLLDSKGMKKTDLLDVISAPTLAKLGKNENVNISVIAKICDFLDCQPGDIMENISEKKLQTIAEQFDIIQKTMIESIKEQGINEEEFMSLANEAMRQLFNNEYSMQNMMNQAINKNKTSDTTNTNDEN